MSETVKKRIDEICELIPENHLFTKTYINSHKGEYPVYSATLGEPYGYVDYYLFENKKVLVVVNYGRSGSTYIINDSKFSIGRNICGLYIKDEYKNIISLEYLMIVATPIFVNKSKGAKQKNLNQNMVKETLVPIPVDSSGVFDLDKQMELAEIYEKINEKKKYLQVKAEELSKICVTIDTTLNMNYKNVRINELFVFKGGEMRYSKAWCNKHNGQYPVYSGSATDTFAYVDEYIYDGDYLTWVIDGLAGYMKKLSGKFGITCHRGIFIPIQNNTNIDLDYIKCVLEPIFRLKRRGRIGINEKNEYTALKPTHIKNFNIEIPIPIKEDGTFDLEKQQYIANKFKTINKIKESLKDKINEIIDIVIEV